MTDDTVDFASKSSKHSGIRAMINLAAPDLAVNHNRLDADPYLLNCRNGIVNLRTGQLSPHNSSNLLTKICPVDFDPAARCPRFDEFTIQVFVTDELVNFVQRLIGYAITGSVAEQVLPIFWGVGSNGKTTLLTLLQHVFGDYAGQAPPSLLMLRKNDQHPTEIAGLFGMRLVVASETEGNCRLAEALVKQLTGGDVISARRMREDFWTFRPTHKLILSTNHKPKVRGTDHGIWRRLLLVPFTRVFDGPRKDKQLPEKMIAASRAATIYWRASLTFTAGSKPGATTAAKHYRAARRSATGCKTMDLSDFTAAICNIGVSD